MKAFGHLILLCCFSPSLIAQNISDLDAFEKAVKPGTQLIYDVAVQDKHYTLTITLKQVGNEVSFDWITGDPDNKSGSVAMSANALQNAVAINSTLKSGDVKLDNETAFWISKKIFNDIANTAQASLKLNGATDTATNLGNTIGEFNFNMNGNLMAIPGWELTGGPDNKYTIDILESKIPLIYKIDMGFSMILTEVKNP